MSGDLDNATERLDLAELGRLLRDRRGSLSLRQAAEAAGVSFSTFSRVEGGAQPDLVSFTKLCTWLGLPPSKFFRETPQRIGDGLETAVQHLYADPRLTTENATRLANMLKDMYSVLAAEPVGVRYVACHLRAERVLRPGVSERLSALLSDMENELERLVDAGEL